MRVFQGPLRAALALLLLAPGLAAQEGDKETFVTLPPLAVYKFSPENYFIIRGKVAAHQADFIRRLRRVPAVVSVGEPSSLIIETYLKRKSRSFGTSDAYVESDWLKPEELAVAAALVPRTALAVDELFGVPERHQVKEVILRTREDYYALTDAWAKEDHIRRMARSFSSIWVEGYREGWKESVPDAYSIVMADTVRMHVPDSFRAQTALLEGLHAYFTAMAIGEVQYYVAAETTPDGRNRGTVDSLYSTSREVLARPKHEDLEKLFRAELNALSFERLAVAFSLVDFLLQKDREVWKRFILTLDRESHEGGKLKGPDGRYQAVVSAIQEALGLDLKELDKELGAFTKTSYLFTEELARRVGLDRECADSAFQGFETVCRLKREGKPVSEKGERIYTEILKRLEKKMEKERF